MPFGAEVLEDGRTRFSLWAPAAETVDLVFEDGTIPMFREENGTFSLTTGAGTRYRIDGGQVVPDPLYDVERPPGRLLYASEDVRELATRLPGRSVVWYLAG
jgi:1,4-alpha-glucan branching enzyme